MSRLLSRIEELAEDFDGLDLSITLVVRTDADVDRVAGILGRPVDGRGHRDPHEIELDGTRWRGAETRILGATVLVSGPHTPVATRRKCKWCDGSGESCTGCEGSGFVSRAA
jgi:hypothetical protein